jgi:hypothetical protein
MVLKLDLINWLSPKHHSFIELTLQVMHTSLEQMIVLGIKADSQVHFSYIISKARIPLGHNHNS